MLMLDDPSESVSKASSARIKCCTADSLMLSVYAQLAQLTNMQASLENGQATIP